MTTTPPEQHAILHALGQRIAALRASAGLTQDQLSELADIDIQAVQRAETDRSALSFERLAKIAGALGVDLGDLFRFDAPVAVPVQHSAEEAQIVAAFRGLPADRKPLVVPLLRVLAKQ